MPSRICISPGKTVPAMGDVLVARCDIVKKQPLHFRWNCQMLAVFWIFGTICGIFLFLYAGTPVFSLMRRMPLASVSIVSLLGIGLIPFLFTAYAVYVSKRRLIFLICFCKACLYAFIAAGIYAVFSSAGWLMYGLLLFSGGILCADLYFLWLRLLSGRNGCWIWTVTVWVLAGSMVDHIISPFLACLIEL